MSQRMFQDLKYAADRLEADLKKTQSTLNITKVWALPAATNLALLPGNGGHHSLIQQPPSQGELKQAQMEFERSKKLEEDAMSSLKKARATVAERDAELSEMMVRTMATPPTWTKVPCIAHVESRPCNPLQSER